MVYRSTNVPFAHWTGNALFDQVVAVLFLQHVNDLEKYHSQIRPYVGGQYHNNDIGLSVIQLLFFPHYQFIITFHTFGFKLAIVSNFILGENEHIEVLNFQNQL